MFCKRGSLWRKWDLHVHTPASIKQQYGDKNNEEVWERFITELEQLPEEYSVLGINDYLFVDGYERLLKEKEENGRLKNIDLLLPVVEFRIEKFIGVEFGQLKRINLHVIFSDEVSVETIRSQFLNTLSQSYKVDGDKEWHRAITRESLKDLGKNLKEEIPPEKLKHYSGDLNEGFNNLSIPEKQIRDSLEKDCFEDKYLMAIGKTEWADLNWSKSTIASKKDIINRPDLVFTAAENVKRFIKSKASLREQNVNDLLLDCSDAHYFSDSSEKDRIGNSFTWIKADPDFLGLKQIINEPENRVFVGEEPNKIRKVRSNTTKYLSKVSFEKERGSEETELWFEKTKPIEFNNDLVAIIGNKGMGKSALADIIALTSNSKREIDDFSFLNDQKFRHKQDNKAKHFRATTTWHDGKKCDKNLNENVDHKDYERVHYLPQKYIEKVCNEIGVKEESEFDKQLEKVIFSHVPSNEKLGHDTLRELIEVKTNEVNERIQSISNEVETLNKEIVSLKNKLSSTYKEDLERKLQSKRDELEALEENPPAEVPKPDTSEEIQKKMEEINSKIKDVREEIDELENREEKRKNDLEDVTEDVESAKKIISRLENFKKDYNKLISDLSMHAEKLEIQMDDVISLDIDYKKVETKKNKLESKKESIESDLSIKGKKTLSRKLKARKLYLKWLQEKLDRPNREYQNYLTEKKNWEKKKDKIIGDEETQGTIEYLESQIKEIEDVPERLEEKEEERLNKSLEIYEELNKLKKIYQKLHEPVVDYINELEIKGAEFSINFDVQIISQNFKDRFLGMIDKSVSGSYYGEENANKLISKIHDKYSFDNEENIRKFLNEIVTSLETNQQKGEAANVGNQLRKGVKEKDIYDFVFSLDYLKPKYGLKLGDKEIGQLSPGERGTLLLIFYLLVDQDERPIIIDQPEENLDNETIFDTLVPCIKKAKERRQIIIVTHNPNLAVVCDAEQIISAKIDKENGNQVSYTTGSIENPEINREILDILEGTRPAFDNRDAKYIV